MSTTQRSTWLMSRFNCQASEWRDIEIKDQPWLYVVYSLYRSWWQRRKLWWFMETQRWCVVDTGSVLYRKLGAWTLVRILFFSQVKHFKTSDCIAIVMLSRSSRHRKKWGVKPSKTSCDIHRGPERSGQSLLTSSKYVVGLLISICAIHPPRYILCIRP